MAIIHEIEEKSLKKILVTPTQNLSVLDQNTGLSD